MKLQYISDQNGVHKSVVISIEDWNKMKEKYSDLENELDNNFYHLSKEQEIAIDKALNSGKEISHNSVIKETKKKYPHLFKNH